MGDLFLKKNNFYGAWQSLDNIYPQMIFSLPEKLNNYTGNVTDG